MTVAALPDTAFVQLQSSSPPLQVRALRGVGAPQITGGYAIWEKVARPHRKALTRYQGRDPFQMTLPLLLEGFDGNVSVEPEIRALEMMALPPTAGSDPPTVTVAGAVPHPELDWVIGGSDPPLEWDASPIWSPNGYRIRQAVTVHLLEHVGDDSNDTATVSAVGSSAAGTSAAGVYVVNDGDTLQSIAALRLGSASRWHEIADLNDIRDPRRLTVGQRLLMPR